MALPTDQIKSAFLLYNGSLIPATGAILFVLFCQGKTLGRVKLIFSSEKPAFCYCLFASVGDSHEPGEETPGKGHVRSRHCTVNGRA